QGQICGKFAKYIEKNEKIAILVLVLSWIYGIRNGKKFMGGMKNEKTERMEEVTGKEEQTMAYRP
ncbi:MAG: hypothetical protein Q4G59_08455, partial [Planctomycetia bacterium]|nr:hypothetical protein [Planctomycetia bacterium]